MTKSELNKFRNILEAKQAELSQCRRGGGHATLVSTDPAHVPMFGTRIEPPL